MKKIHDQRLSSASPSSGPALSWKGNLDERTTSPSSVSTSIRGNRSQAAIDRSRKACKRCAKLKMKCDGQQPCQRCANDVRLSISCSYHHKPHERTQINAGFQSTSLPVYAETPSIPLQQNPEDFIIAREGEQDGIMALASAALAGDMYENDDSNIIAPNSDASDTHHLQPSTIDSMMVFDEGDMHPSLFADLLDESKGTFSWLFSGTSSDFGIEGMTWPNSNIANAGAVTEGVHISINDGELQNFERGPEVQNQESALISSNQQFESQNNQAEDEISQEEQLRRNDHGNLVWPNGRSSENATQELTIVPLSIEEADVEILAFENTYQVVQVQNGIQDRMASLPGMSDLSSLEKDRAKTMLEKTPTQAINAFVQLYFEHYDQLCPIIHRPKFDPNTCHPFLLSAICAIGAMYSAVPKANIFAKNLMVLVNRTWFANFAKQSRHMVNIQLMQTLLLNINFFRSSGNRRMLELAESARSPLTTMIRRSKLLETTKDDTFQTESRTASSRSPSHPMSTKEKISPPLHDDDKDWYRWIEIETGRRLGWMFFICDVELSAVWNLPPSFGLHELKTQLPSDERSWRANGRLTWARLRSTRMPIYLGNLLEELQTNQTQQIHETEISSNLNPASVALQKVLFACALCSLGLALGNIRSSPMSFITNEANQHHVSICSTFVIREKAHKLGNDFAELLVRFALLRHKVDIIDLQLLTGRAARHADISVALNRIKSSLFSNGDRKGLMAHLIHCGRIVHLYRSRPIDSTYADCILFYAISALYAFSCLWPDLEIGTRESNAGQRNEFCIDGESFIDVDYDFDLLSCRLTMKGVGCITSQDAPQKLMAICAEELLVRPSGTSWPIGKLLGNIAKEIGSGNKRTFSSSLYVN